MMFSYLKAKFIENGVACLHIPVSYVLYDLWGNNVFATGCDDRYVISTLPILVRSGLSALRKHLLQTGALTTTPASTFV